MSDAPTDHGRMRLRAEAPQVTRLSRKMLASLAAVALFGIGGVAIVALQSRGGGERGEELYSTDNRQTADGLSGLPSDYAGPILGPPLPGDLGGPILSAQNEGQAIVAPIPTPLGIGEAEQRRRAEEEAARLSAVFFQADAGATQFGAAAGAVPDLGGFDAWDGAETGGQNSHRDFLNATPDRRTVTPDRVTPPASPFVLQAGAVISAALITGIRSDLPGQIIAQVTEHIYDSPTGRIVLVPQGTRLIGQYDSGVQFGQSRVLLVWNRMIMPNGRSIVLERQPGTDSQGFAGLEDGIDYHWWDLAKAAALSTLFGVGTELGTDDSDRLLAAIRGSEQDSITEVGEQIIQRQLQLAPTLTIRPGFPVRIIVTRDLVLEPYGSAT